MTSGNGCRSSGRFQRAPPGEQEVMNNASNRMRPTAQRLTMAVLSLGAVAVVTACGSSGVTGSGGTSAPATSASGTPATGSGSASGLPCAQVTALRSTLTDLSNTPVSISSAGRLATDLAKAEQELNALKSQAGPFAAQANQLSTALNAIKTNAAAIAKSPTPTNITNLTNSVTSFKSTADPLIKEMQAACP
jgi:hypothetical protein